jgi:hypothetical protein
VLIWPHDTGTPEVVSLGKRRQLRGAYLGVGGGARANRPAICDTCDGCDLRALRRTLGVLKVHGLQNDKPQVISCTTAMTVRLKERVLTLT